MINEAHGDTCRLGYLRVIACIAYDMVSRTPDYMSSLLLEISRLGRNPRETATGLIKSKANAMNYVGLSTDLGILRKGDWTAGETAIMYSALRSATPIHELVSRGGPAGLIDLTDLTPLEKLFFLDVLLWYDFEMMTGLIGWVLDHHTFTRNQAMEEMMETVYPQALKKAVKESSGKAREKIQRKLEVAEYFAQNRMRYSSRTEWVRSRQYAVYRHTLPPRLEWLVDLGILGREGRGRYTITRDALALSRELKIVVESSRDKVSDNIISYLASTILGARPPDRNKMMEALLHTYNQIQSRLKSSMSLELLKKATTYSLLEDGWAAPPSQVGRVFSNLAVMFPDRVFVKPGPSGIVEVTRLEVTPSEIKS
jgi:hypothetical protein